MPPSPIDVRKRWKLPPLILHPVSDPLGPHKIMQSSRASLMLQGLVPNEDLTTEELNEQFLEGRLHELRMLHYLGKDLERWATQCMEQIQRDEELKDAGIGVQSFAALLVEDPPAAVAEKLRKWGVSNHKTIFARALGLNAILGQAPEREMLAESFLRGYHRYCDVLFACRQQSSPFTPIRSVNFEFELYASGEYSRLLEQEWEQS